MRQIAAIEINAIVKELQEVVGSYLKKFYDLGDNSYRLLFSSTAGNKIIYIKLTQAMNLTNIVEEVEEPTNFAKGVRKRLLGRKLKRIDQRYSDRIVIFEFEGEPGYKLIVEMFGKGNMIITDSEYNIEILSNSLHQKERALAPHVIYQFPPSIKVDIDNMQEPQVTEIINTVMKSKERIIKELSRSVDIGPVYLEDVLIRSGVDPKSKGVDLKLEKSVIRNMVSFFRQLKAPKPVAYLKNGEFVDYAIVPIEKYKECEAKNYETVSKALEAFYLESRTKLDKNDDEVREKQANLDKQLKLIEELTLTEKQDAEKGHKVMSNMHQINEIINYINEKRRVTVEELNEKFHIKVKSLDLKNKLLTIEIE
ncbi:MAG: NFACT family protein [Candidatus Micrarchaeota archaeon]|nr:NFACT family protein [Candidatus Micrarchaeota archaeon]